MLLSGVILAPDRRTMTGIPRITGLARDRLFVNDHRVLNRVAQCLKAASRILSGSAFVPARPKVPGADDAIARRRGSHIAARGIKRDPVRSSHGHVVEAGGLRWRSLMLPAPILRAGRIRACHP